MKSASRLRPLVSATALVALAAAAWALEEPQTREPAGVPAETTGDGKTAPRAEPVHVPVAGTHVSLAPPPGFVRASRFLGFELAERKAWIMVMQLPGAPYAQTTAGLRSEKAMASRGMKLLDHEEITIGGKPAFLANVTQAAGGMELEKWMLAAQCGGGITLITAACQVEDRERIGVALEESVRGVRISEQRHEAAALFEVGASEHLTERNDVGGASSFTLPGRFGKKSDGFPVLLVARSHAAVPVSDWTAWLKRRLRQMPYVDSISEEATKERKLGELDAVELTANVAERDGRAITFHVLVVVPEEGGTYWLLVAQVGADQRERWEPELRKMLDGFRVLDGSK